LVRLQPHNDRRLTLRVRGTVRARHRLLRLATRTRYWVLSTSTTTLFHS
jgi:hypothetical protein